MLVASTRAGSAKGPRATSNRVGRLGPNAQFKLEHHDRPGYPQEERDDSGRRKGKGHLEASLEASLMVDGGHVTVRKLEEGLRTPLLHWHGAVSGSVVPRDRAAGKRRRATDRQEGKKKTRKTKATRLETECAVVTRYPVQCTRSYPCTHNLVQVCTVPW